MNKEEMQFWYYKCTADYEHLMALIDMQRREGIETSEMEDRAKNMNSAICQMQSIAFGC